MLTAEIDSKFKVKGAGTDGIVDVNLVLLWWQGSNYLDFLHWNTIPSILYTCIFIGIISGSCKGGDWSNQNAVSLYFSSQQSNWCSCVTCFKHAEHSQKLKDRSCYFLVTKKKNCGRIHSVWSTLILQRAKKASTVAQNTFVSVAFLLWLFSDSLHVGRIFSKCC